MGPNTTFFELTNARRALQGQERTLALARQRTAVEVAAAFYSVIAQRQLLEVARQSLERTEALQKSSEARLEVGLASKLDVFRAELQAAQARDAMLRSQSSLATALERFRAQLAIPPGDPVEPEAVALPTTDDVFEPVEVLVQRALDTRLELAEARDQVSDAERSASLAKQNLLPQLDLNVGVTQLGFGSSFGTAWSAGDNAGQRLPERVLPAAAGEPARDARRCPARGRLARARGAPARARRRAGRAPGAARARADPAERRACSVGRSTWPTSSAGWRCCATSAASAATSTWSTPRAAWSPRAARSSSC